MQIDWSGLAQKHPGLASLPAALRAAASRIDFAAGGVLCLRGAKPTHMYYVLAGELRLVRHTASGDKLVLQRSRQGFVAEASMEAAVYHCDIEAFAAGRLLAFPIAAFRQALDDEAGFSRAWAARMAVEIRRLRAQNERLHLHKAADRVLHYLESEGSGRAVTLAQSRKAWAAELGLSHEALYRTLRQMENTGLLQVSGNRIAAL